MSKPLQYRKKPVVIEAMRFYADELVMMAEVARWCGGCIRSLAKASDHTYWLEIPTLEGVMTASPGDYVIKGAQGEFRPCKPDVFEATYERVGLRGES